MRLRLHWQGLVFCLAAAAAWEITAGLQLVPVRLFPPLSTVLAQLFALTSSGVLPLALAKTLSRMAWGLLAAAVLMIPLGLWTGRSARVWLTIAPTVESLRSLPPALVILPTMLVLGIGDAMKIFAVFFAASFPILLNTMDGVRAIPVLFLDTARTFRAGKLALLFGIIIPATAPGMFSGLRTALPIAFIVAIVSEMIGSDNGIGHFLMRSQRTFDIPQMDAAILATALVGGLLAWALNLIESVCLVWYSGWKRIAGRRYS